MLKPIGWILGIVIAVVAALAAVGWFLPIGHVASRSATFSVPAEKLFEVVADIEKYPTWWHDVSRIELLPPQDGRTRFRQHDSSGAVVMEVVEATRPSRFVTRIADPDQPFGGTWTFELAPVADGTRLTITERGEVYNPVFRLLARFVFGYTGAMESYLAALRTALPA